MLDNLFSVIWVMGIFGLFMVFSYIFCRFILRIKIE